MKIMLSKDLVSMPDLYNCVVGEPSPLNRLSTAGSLRAMFKTSSATVSPLLHLICHIVGIRSLKQMLPVTAGRVVANMEYAEWVRIIPGCQGVRHPSSVKVAVRNANNSIAMFVSASHPWPALIRPAFINAGPKARNVGWRERRKRFTLVSSHLISFQDLLVRAARARRTLSWPNLHYSTEVC